MSFYMFFLRKILEEALSKMKKKNRKGRPRIQGTENSTQENKMIKGKSQDGHCVPT